MFEGVGSCDILLQFLQDMYEKMSHDMLELLAVQE